jgi:hypothetical protein
MMPDYHTCIIRPKADFKSNSWRTQKRDHDGKPYDAILGKLKDGGSMTEHSYHYPPDDWTESSARQH